MHSRTEDDFLGLAPFLRLSINGADLRQIAQALLDKAGQDQDNPALWMNLSTAFFAIGERQLGLAMQEQALQLQRLYALPALHQPARVRLLVLLSAGDLAENTPVDCLLEKSEDIDLVYAYATPGMPLPPDLPAHDVLLLALSDTTDTRPILDALEPLLADWPCPVINTPAAIRNTERGRASALLGDVPGLLMPPTRLVSRATLVAMVMGTAHIEDVFEGCCFPIILRPIGSQAGRDLDRLESADDIPGYLSRVSETEFYLSRFIDYSGADGRFRKYRVALIDGQPFACHMGISSHWMIHYLNAGMYEDAAKRAEEQAFMEHFTDFARRHAPVLDAVYRRSGLDYLCIDCAETRDGQLLIFEMDHAMVVHAMDPEDLFPYKQVHMLKVRHAFEAALATRAVHRPQPESASPSA
ncbi:hypothetical protein [Zoogloea sp.]|uniref:ATP-grasp domain-containing protein n=1 Tax=Zoogloea sp. TaxID=49181 RepID=UPI001415755A|nr:MAG: hypothetical protein F9K15_18885 [Zoogloea sp.]